MVMQACQTQDPQLLLDLIVNTYNAGHRIDVECRLWRTKNPKDPNKEPAFVRYTRQLVFWLWPFYMFTIPYAV